ncbi:MAG: ThiS family [Dehalococcoidia bacterium]|nr:ThiS family [Dehalococcoidia bacterium]
MKVRLSSNIPLGRDEVEMSGPEATLRDLVEKLAEPGIGLRLVDAQTGKVGQMFALSVNRRQYDSLPGGLDTKLKDNDSVEIALAMFAGG